MQYKEIYINKQIRNEVITNMVIKNLPQAKKIYIDDKEAQYLLTSCIKEDFAKYRDTLLLTKNKGKFFKLCPGTREYICCLYRILNVGLNCNLGCSYCILQAYFENPQLTIFANLEEMYQELCCTFKENPQSFFRIGTGEFTDSLFLDSVTGFSKIVVPFFIKQDNAILEFKTKSTCIENLLTLEHRQKIFISWSLNTPFIIENEELFTPKLEERLQAARKCQERGFPVGFHFDPIFYYPEWERDYQQVINKLFEYIDPERIVWISMGCFRYLPELKSIISQRYPKTRICYQEFIDGIDGKKRYFKDIRIEIYKKLASWIRNVNQDILIYLCMESEEVWHKSMGFAPKNNKQLSKMLDQRAIYFSCLTL